MHHFICQFCHTDLYAEGAKIYAMSTCACAKETNFSQSLPRGEL